MINKHVTSLELSKKLKELGVPQESLFYWHIDSMNEFDPRIKMGLPSGDKATYGISAYLASELGEMLPKEVNFHGKNHFFIKTWKRGASEIAVKYDSNDGHSLIPVMFAQTEADARAKMLIYLLENSLLKPEDLV